LIHPLVRGRGWSGSIPYCVVQFFISPKPYLKEARILEQWASSFLGSFLITFFTFIAHAVQYARANHIPPIWQQR
jgi:Na+(H+)/acetate symporter ActP